MPTDNKWEQVQFVKQRAERRAQAGFEPEPRAMLNEAQDRYPEVQTLDVDRLLLKYFLYYASALAAPDEPAEVTVKRWLRS